MKRSFPSLAHAPYARWLVLGLAGLGLLCSGAGGPGCSESKPGFCPDDCASDDDCDDGFSCRRDPDPQLDEPRRCVPSAPCRKAADCGPHGYCDQRGVCDAEGVCLPRPCTTHSDIDWVCGCDGENYANGDVANQQGGTSAAFDGFCEYHGKSCLELDALRGQAVAKAPRCTSDCQTYADERGCPVSVSHDTSRELALTLDRISWQRRFVNVCPDPVCPDAGAGDAGHGGCGDLGSGVDSGVPGFDAACR